MVTAEEFAKMDEASRVHAVQDFARSAFYKELLPKIAEHFCIGEEWARVYLGYFQLVVPKHRRNKPSRNGRGRVLTEADMTAIYVMQLKGMSYAEIAVRYGTTPVTVHRRLKQLGRTPTQERRIAPRG